MEKILFIVNPVSGKQQIRKYIPDVEKILLDAGKKVDIVNTQYHGHAKDLSLKAKEQGYDTIICCGGDGTLNEIFTGLLSSNTNDKIKVGYLPCGSTNDFAKTIGLSLYPIQEALNILSENIKPMDVGKFGDDKYFSYIAAFGALTDASYMAPTRLKNTIGHFAYILEGIKDAFHIKPIKAKIIIDGQVYEDTFAYASCSNTMSVGGVAKLSPDIVDLGDGLFEVILVRYPKNPKELAAILWGATHSDFSSKLFEFKKAKEVIMEFDGEIPFTLDGEKAVAKNKVIIKNLEKAINLYF